MASYINGISDFVPSIQPFSPDLNFYQYALQTKQMQYQQNYSKVSNVYGSLLKSPIINQMTSQRRDDFFKQVNDQIQTISQHDLSNPQNVNTAMGIFQPLIDDPYVSSGINKTRMYMDEAGKAEQLRNCVKTKDNPCDGYWQEGVQDLNNWAQDYSTASLDDAKDFNNPRYVKGVNYAEAVPAFIEKNHLTIISTGFKDISQHGNQPGLGMVYKVKNQNGAQFTIPLYNILYSTLGSDDAIQDVFRVKARLQMRNEVNNLLPRFQGDRNAAEDFYQTQVMNQLSKRQQDYQKQLKDHGKNTDARIGVLSDAVDKETDHGAYPIKSSDTLPQLLSAMVNQKKMIGQASSIASDASIDPQKFLTSERLNKRYQIESAIADDKMRGEFYNLADYYAKATAESEMTPEEYSKMNWQNKFAMNLISAKISAKKGISQGPQPGDEVRAGNIRLDQKGNAIPVNPLAINQSEEQRYQGLYIPPMKDLSNSLFSKLAEKYVNGKDHERTDAYNEMRDIYGKNSIDALIATGKPLTSQHIYDAPGYSNNQMTIFKNIENKWEDNSFDSLYKKDIKDPLTYLYEQAHQQREGMDSAYQYEKDSNAAMLKYIASSGKVSKEDKIGIPTIFDNNGMLLDEDSFADRMKNVFPRDQAIQYRNKYFGKYMDLTGSNPKEGDIETGKSVLKPLPNPFLSQGTGGLTSRPAIGEVNTSSAYSHGTAWARVLENSFDVNQPLGISFEESPTKDTQMLTPDKDKIEYNQAMFFANAYLKEIRNESISPTEKKLSLGTEIIPNIGNTNSITIKPSPALFAKIQDEFKRDTPSKTGLAYDKFKTITFQYDKNNSPEGIFGNLRYGPTDYALNEGKTVLIAPRGKENGYATVARTSNNNIDVTYYYKAIGDKKGEKKDVILSQYDLPSNLTLDMIEGKPGTGLRAKIVKDLIDADDMYHALRKFSPEFRGDIYSGPQVISDASVDTGNEEKPTE